MWPNLVTVPSLWKFHQVQTQCHTRLPSEFPTLSGHAFHWLIRRVGSITIWKSLAHNFMLNQYYYRKRYVIPLIYTSVFFYTLRMWFLDSEIFKWILLPYKFVLIEKALFMFCIKPCIIKKEYYQLRYVHCQAQPRVLCWSENVVF